MALYISLPMYIHIFRVTSQIDTIIGARYVVWLYGHSAGNSISQLIERIIHSDVTAVRVNLFPFYVCF